MKINIVRGQNQIGGSIICVETNLTKLYFDVGDNLKEPKNETEKDNFPHIEGLFYGKKDCDGIFISHYHFDHIGLLKYALKDIPIYMGYESYNIYTAAAGYMRKHIFFTPQYIYNKKDIKIKDITITPILCDHSAYDSYMFLINADNKTVLYTGDFRANGRKDFNDLLNNLPCVDAVIIEGTLLSRETFEENINEKKLEDIAVDYINKHCKDGPAFIMMSSQNIDRVITARNIAKRTNRLFLEDVYTADLVSSLTDKSLAPNKKEGIRVFLYDNREHPMLEKYGWNSIKKEDIFKNKYVMCVRPKMQGYFNNRIKEGISLNGGVLFFAMWTGYLDNSYKQEKDYIDVKPKKKEENETKEFVEFMAKNGVKLHTLHTSGHADINTIDKLIKKIQPRMIIPVHTENPKWFEKYIDIADVICDKSEIDLN